MTRERTDKTITELILEVRQEFPGIKSDKMLCYRVYERICKNNGSGIYIPFELFKKLPAFETISRARRKLDEETQTIKAREGEITTKPMNINNYPRVGF